MGAEFYLILNRRKKRTKEPLRTAGDLYSNLIEGVKRGISGGDNSGLFIKLKKEKDGEYGRRSDMGDKDSLGGKAILVVEWFL